MDEDCWEARMSARAKERQLAREAEEYLERWTYSRAREAEEETPYGFFVNDWRLFSCPTSFQITWGADGLELTYFYPEEPEAQE